MAPSSRLTVSCPNGVQFPNSVTISRKVKVVVATALATSAVLTLDGESAPRTAAMSILRPVPRKAAVIRTVPAAHAVERPARAASRDAFLWWPAAGHAGCRSHAAVGQTEHVWRRRGQPCGAGKSNDPDIAARIVKPRNAPATVRRTGSLDHQLAPQYRAGEAAYRHAIGSWPRRQRPRSVPRYVPHGRRSCCPIPAALSSKS